MRVPSWMSCFRGRRPARERPRAAPPLSRTDFDDFHRRAAEAAAAPPRRSNRSAAADDRREEGHEATAPEAGPPPASRAALDRLPVVRVRGGDDHDDSTCCAICLEALEPNDRATRMPCGHTFHVECAQEWLARRCTCPTCRFEIATENADFERGRVLRNRRHRRLVRIRRTELRDLPVRAVRDLLAAAGESDRQCLERSDLVKVAVESDFVEVVEDRLFTTRADLAAASVASLVKLAKRANLQTHHRGLEKADLVDALLGSGDVVLVDADDPYDCYSRRDPPPAAVAADATTEPPPPTPPPMPAAPAAASETGGFRRGFLLSP